MSQRYFLGSDNDGHWFIVPLDKQAEWEAWTNLDPDDPAAWDAPDWAQVVGGSHQLVTFENPEVK